MSTPVLLLLLAASAGTLIVSAAFIVGRWSQRALATSLLYVAAVACFLAALYSVSDARTDGVSCGQAFHAAFGELSTGGDRDPARIARDHAACREAGRSALGTAAAALVAAGFLVLLGRRTRRSKPLESMTPTA